MVRLALTMNCSAAALDPMRAPGPWLALRRVCHTPQPTPPVTDDDEDDEDDDAPDRGSDGGNIDPDDDEGWSDEDDEDDDDTRLVGRRPRPARAPTLSGRRLMDRAAPAQAGPPRARRGRSAPLPVRLRQRVRQ